MPFLYTKGNMKKSPNEKYADRSITIEIKPDDVSCAKVNCPRDCVLAKAFKANPMFANNFDKIRVLWHFTKVTLKDGKTLVWRTPKNLRPALKKFDAGLGWDGPKDGKVTFEPCQYNRRTKEQTEKTKAEDAIRRPKGCKPKHLVRPRYLVP